VPVRTSRTAHAVLSEVLVKLSRFHAVAGATGTVALMLAGVGLAGSASAATSVMSGSSGLSARDARCSVPLPGSVIGDPGTKGGQASGARVWHDRGGWHVRVTHPGSGTEVFTGVVHSPQAITLTGYRLEKEDSIKLTDGGHTLTYRLVNHGAIDGVDFTDRCAINTSFDLYRDGGRLSTSDVYLGAGGAHPLGNPFLVQRRR
jgi:hypothetical protein